MFEVTALSRFMVNPREGHLDQTYQRLAYLKYKMNNWLVMDLVYVNTSCGWSRKAEWSTFYPYAVEEVDPDDPTLL